MAPKMQNTLPKVVKKTLRYSKTINRKGTIQCPNFLHRNIHNEILNTFFHEKYKLHLFVPGDQS